MYNSVSEKMFDDNIKKETNSMRNKTVLITGCTSGIGKATAQEIAMLGANVIMGCRNIEKAEEVKDEISKITKNHKIHVRQLDLASFKSIREFSKSIYQEFDKLDVLIHNAGIALSFKKQISENGLELTMATNHFGPFLLTILLIDLLKRSAPSRVIVVTSEWYPMGCLNFDNLNPTSRWKAHYNYYVSKYANIVWTLELARRLSGSGVTANCLHPGKIFTNIWQANTPKSLFLCIKPFLKKVLDTPKEGALTSVYLAVSNKVENISGEYFKNCNVFPLQEKIKDPKKGKQLWEISEKIVELRPEDPRI